MGAKKPLVFLYENDDRTFSCVKYLYFSITNRAESSWNLVLAQNRTRNHENR